MTAWLAALLGVIGATLRDVLPIALVLVLFQAAVVRRRPPHLGRVLFGFGYVLLGLALFLLGLEQALFPLGRVMAAQLTDPAFVTGTTLADASALHWSEYGWVYAFAIAIGFSTTLAEPSLIAVALKASEVSAGAIRPVGLRVAVAVGVAAGVGLGVFRIVTGAPIQHFIVAGYVVVLVQTCFAPRLIVPLAFDSGGVTTSTVTVPLVAALGLGLAETIPGRSALVDGFGLIAFASLFPIISVMSYAQLAERASARRGRAAS